MSSSSLDIEGEVLGNVKCEHLTIRHKGSVQGDITTHTATIHGSVKGTIYAKHIRFGKTASFKGKIFYSTIVVDSGANLEGMLERSELLNLDTDTQASLLSSEVVES